MSPLAALSHDLAELVARAAPSVVGLEHRRGQGSGVVLAPDGWILTNAHVARGPGPLTVRLSGARVARGELVGSDARTDLAVVRTDARDLAALALSERRLRVGELVLAIGNPLGFERSVTAGVVSALHRNLPAGPRGDGVLEGLVQTDAAVNPGNSGGPLLDAEGRVVGITTAMLPWARGIGFAVPARTASWIASVLMADGEVRRPFLGVSARGEDLDLADAREAGHGRGVRVLEVMSGSPAEAAGLRPGDLLVAAAGAPTETLDDLVRAMVLGHPAALGVDVVRGGARRSLEIRPRPPERRAA
ncbi:MAG: trypsin-like peptidase domain-containing protein [Anaeromyxobacteraceae bacterium]